MLFRSNTDHRESGRGIHTARNYPNGRKQRSCFPINKHKMCIRDSPVHYARGFITDTHVRSAVVVEVDVAPVSYTHLDVYKRQRYSRSSIRKVLIRKLKKNATACSMPDRSEEHTSELQSRETIVVLQVTPQLIKRGATCLCRIT